MRPPSSRPSWQLPPGVSKGAWDYVTQSHIASQYDSFHHGHPLLEIDRRIVLEVAQKIACPSPEDIPVAMDLGCGTGRTLIPLIDRGWRTIGVDLSRPMLQCAATKAGPWTPSSPWVLVQTNMAQLEFLNDRCLHLATCLYSSIGMIQGRHHRRCMLNQVARVLRPDGRFILHVHNRGIWARDPGGLRRMIRDALRSITDSSWEYGDRVYAYRGLPSMYLHIYSERELRHDLRHAGFHIERIIPLNLTSSGFLPYPRWLRSLRAGGWIVIATPAQSS